MWKFNATLGETIDIPASQIAIDRGRSIAHYTPVTESVSFSLVEILKTALNELKKITSNTYIQYLHTFMYL